MTAALRLWIAGSIERGRFSGITSVLIFAVTRAIATTVAAVGLNFFVYFLFDHFSLFSITRPASAIGDAIVTACVAGPIAFLAFFIFGRAIQSVAISRDEFEHLSRTDSLTGLLNRRAFLEAASRLDAPFALAILDIDRFKSVNDSYGHGAGDEVLMTVSRLMRSHFRDGCMVARLGGEEFGVLMGGFNKALAMAQIDRFRGVLAALHIDVGSATIEVSISAGVAHGESQRDISALLTNADSALYLAKASGRNRVVHVDDLEPLGRLPIAEGKERRMRRAAR